MIDSRAMTDSNRICDELTGLLYYTSLFSAKWICYRLVCRRHKLVREALDNSQFHMMRSRMSRLTAGIITAKLTPRGLDITVTHTCFVSDENPGTFGF